MIKYFLYSFILTSLLLLAFADAKNVTQDGQEYSCTPVKSCEDKLKEARAEIKRLKAKLAEKPTEVIKEVRADEHKNVVMVGVRKDYVGLDGQQNGNTATIYERKNAILDLSYMRRKLFDSRFDAGVGLDARGVARGFVGYEF